jgi:glucosamine--fructose-6-phosphate aminotransferase (isomerizing)
VEALRAGKPLIVTGCGTSYHTALVAARYFQALAGVDAQALPSFDLAWYRPEVARGKVLLAISHSGASKATLDAVAQAGPLASAVLAISAAPSTPLAQRADAHIGMAGGWEKALPKTRIFTAGCFQLLHLAALGGMSRKVAAPLPEPALLRKAMEVTLETARAVIDQAAAEWKRFDVFTFLGGGPAWITAAEAALKMRENNYTYAEGYEAEELSHGRTASFEKDRPVVGILLRGPSISRVTDMLETARYIGAPTMLIVEEGAGPVPQADFTVTIPAMPSEFAAAILAAIPLQFFSHQFSLHRDLDPDTIRLDQPDRAYVENRWIFPPGTH